MSEGRYSLSGRRAVRFFSRPLRKFQKGLFSLGLEPGLHHGEKNFIGKVGIALRKLIGLGDLPGERIIEMPEERPSQKDNEEKK